MGRDPDQEAIEYARKHLDLSKNLNDQGYFGPFPNEADPRTIRRPHDTDPMSVEYYDWVEQWCKDHNYQFDNKRMEGDRLRFLMAERRRQGIEGPYWIEY